jgi:PD-(D/E)XK endonuclease
MEDTSGETKGAKAQGSLRGQPNRKSQGELAELAFMLKAASRGLQLARPWGDNGRYDIIIDSGHKLWRVQVKSTTNFDGYGYRIATYWKSTTKHVTYTAEQIDFLAGYVIPEDTWYILPVKAFTPRKAVLVYPRRSTDHGRYEQYREAWHLMGPEEKLTSAE